MKRRSLAGLLSVVSFVVAPLGCIGCDDAPLKQAPVDGGQAISGLSADQAARVVAKVGDRVITLGDFAKAIERMDQFDRLRYQSKERRRELLDEIIDVELLAAEAKRQGLDKDPEAADALRMILRDALLAEAKLGLQAPAQIPDQDVRAYFEAHADRFSEPERRRVAAIVMSDKAEAGKVLKEALKAKNAGEWGELFFKHSLTAPKKRGPTSPVELAGDLGIVGPPQDSKGGNPKVPEPVREAAFKLRDPSAISPELVESEGRFFIVRLSGMTPPHKRSLAEADRAVRVLLMQENLAAREKALEDDLKKKFPVEIDEAALASVKLPAGAEKAEVPGRPEPGPSAGADGGK